MRGVAGDLEHRTERRSSVASIPRVLGSQFVSYAQNGEDVVLWRALHAVRGGRYVDVGASDPVLDSVTKAFYDRGWRGLNIEPLPAEADLLRTDRPDDVVVQAVISSASASTVTFHEVVGVVEHGVRTGLSTAVDSIAAEHKRAGLQVQDIDAACRRLDDVIGEHGLMDCDVHFLKIDVEGAEHEVLASVDLRRWRPWVLVVEATAPNSSEPTWPLWEPDVLAAGYQFCLFDGLSRFYVADERAQQLKDALSYPACALDAYTTHRTASAEHRVAELTADAQALWTDAVRWRAAALGRWSEDVVEQMREVQCRQAEAAEALADAASARADAASARSDASAAMERVDEMHARLLQVEAYADEMRRAADWAVAQQHHAEDELAAIRRTLSWRLTSPIRAVRRHAARGTKVP